MVDGLELLDGLETEVPLLVVDGLETVVDGLETEVPLLVVDGLETVVDGL